MVKAAKAGSIPFLIGAMNCIGKNMVYTSLKLALAYLLFSNDVRISGQLTGGGAKDEEVGGQREGEYQMIDWILAFRNGPMLEIKARA
jgi:hypothetical protein